MARLRLRVIPPTQAQDLTKALGRQVRGKLVLLAEILKQR